MTRNSLDPNRPAGRFAAIGGLFVVLVLLWSVIDSGLFRSGGPEAVIVDNPETAAAAPQAITDFVRFTQERGSQHADQSHAYSGDGLRLLAAALATFQDRVDVAVPTMAIRALADSIQQDRTATNHARQVRDASFAARAALERIQREISPALSKHTGAIDAAANAISTTEPLLTQADDVQRFFAASAELISDITL
ncbi:MAG: hypothetical protein ACO1Q7_09495 [Gemmatimonas sp.]